MREMLGRLRTAGLWILLVTALGMAGPTTPEAIAVAPCGVACSTGFCKQKCACETPEWGLKVVYCSECPWDSGNPCR